MHSPKPSIPASISFWQTLPFFRPQFQHELYTSGWQNISFHPAHSNCCSVFFVPEPSWGLFLMLLWLCRISLWLQILQQKHMPLPACKRHGRDKAGILGWKFPKWRNILKYAAHEHLGGLDFFTMQKSHIFSSWSWAGEKTSKQLINTIIPDIQERFVLTAGWRGGSLQTLWVKYLLQNEWGKPSQRGCWPHTTGQEPDTLLELQDLNSLWHTSRGKASNVFRHNCLLLLQDLTAPCCSIFGPFLPHSGKTHSFQRGASLTYSCICSLT